MPDVPPDPLARMRQVLQLANQCVLASLERAGFTMTFGELKILRFVAAGYDSPGRITRELGCTQQYVSKATRTLSSQGCLEVATGSADKRRRSLRPTSHGLRAVAISNAWNDRFQEALPAAMEPALLEAVVMLKTSLGGNGTAAPSDRDVQSTLALLKSRRTG